MCTERSMTCTCHTVSAFVFKCHVTYCSMLQCIRACCRSRIERSNCPSCRAISDIYGLCLRCQTSDSSKKNVLAGSALMGARQCLQMNVLCCRCCRSTAVVSCLCCQTILLARHALLVAMVMKVLTGRFGVLGRAGSRCRTRLPEQSVATQMWGFAESNVIKLHLKQPDRLTGLTLKIGQAIGPAMDGNGQCQSARVWHRTWCRLSTAVVSSR